MLTLKQQNIFDVMTQEEQDKVLDTLLTFNQVYINALPDNSIEITPDVYLVGDSSMRPRRICEFKKDDFSEEQKAAAYERIYGEKFDRRKHDSQVAAFYSC